MVPQVQRRSQRVVSSLLAGSLAVICAAAADVSTQTQTNAASQDAGNQAAAVTFTKDVAPILQRSCQSCHRPGSVAPMSLITYEEVRPWARAMKHRISLGSSPNVMPPWYVEKNIGIQRFKNDMSLSDVEIATITAWADSGAPRGNPADLPPPLKFADEKTWQLGTPDLIVRTGSVEVAAVQPDWWGSLDAVPTGLTEDRYVASLEIKEVAEFVEPATKPSGSTVGGHSVIHHANFTTVVDESAESNQRPGPASELRVYWPIHEVGRNQDIFDPDNGKLLSANSDRKSVV